MFSLKLVGASGPNILDPSQELLDIERCCASMPLTGFQKPTGGPSDSPRGTCGTNGSVSRLAGAVEPHGSRGRSKEAQLELPESLGESKPQAAKL